MKDLTLPPIHGQLVDALAKLEASRQRNVTARARLAHVAGTRAAVANQARARAAEHVGGDQGDLSFPGSDYLTSMVDEETRLRQVGALATLNLPEDEPG